MPRVRDKMSVKPWKRAWERDRDRYVWGPETVCTFSYWYLLWWLQYKQFDVSFFQRNGSFWRYVIKKCLENVHPENVLI